MKTKRILAASTAALLAFGTTAAYMASAEETATTTAKTDNYTLELVPGTKTETEAGNWSAHIKTTLKSSALTDLIAPTVAAGVALTDVPSFKNYIVPDKIETATIEANVNGTLTDPKYTMLVGDGTTAASAVTNHKLSYDTNIAIADGITSGLKLVEVTKGSSAAGKIAGATYEVSKEFVGFGAIQDEANPYNKLAMGLSIIPFADPDGGNDIILAENETFKMTNIKMTATLAGEGTDTTTLAQAQEVKPNQKRTATGSCTFGDITGGKGINKASGVKKNTEGAYATEPKGMNLSFGLSSSKTLDRIITNDSEFTVEFDVEMSPDLWKKVVTAAGIQWSGSYTGTGTNTWTSINWDKLVNDKAEELLNVFLGIEGTSVVDWAVKTSTTESLQVGKLPINAVDKVVATGSKKADDTTKEKKNYFMTGVTQNPWSAVTNPGKINSNNVDIYVGLGTTKNEILKNLNNGGTVTFEFDKDIRPQDIFNPYIIWKGASGLVNMPLSLTNTYEGTANTLTLSFPAGLTWAEGNTNFYNSFNMSFNLNYENAYAIQDGRATGVAIEGGSAGVTNLAARNSFFEGGEDDNGDKNYGAHLVKITFKANGAPASGTNSGSTGTNSGSGNGGSGSTNPETGIALAIAPVVLAAGAVAVVALKKKH